MSQPDRNAPYLLGHDVGGTKLAVVIADRNGNILHKVRRPTEAERGPEAVVATLVDMSREAWRAPASPRRTWPVSRKLGGPLDTEPAWSTRRQSAGLGRGPLKAWLERALSLPAFVENDANAGALAEWSFGAGRGFRHMVYMTMSTGIGGGIILDGRLYRGPNDTAGEVGHMTIVENGPACGCGKRGCLESLCSGPSIARRAREKAQAAPDSLMIALAGGDPVRHYGGNRHGRGQEKNDPVRPGEIVDETARYIGHRTGEHRECAEP